MRTALRVFAGLLGAATVMLTSFAFGDSTQFDTVPVPLPVYLLGGALWCGAPIWGPLAGIATYRALTRRYSKGK